MDEQLKALHKVLQSYKNSIVANLDAINEEVLHVMTSLDIHDMYAMSARRYQVSLVMLEMVPQYLKMLHISQTELQKLTKREFERHFPLNMDQKDISTSEDASAASRPNIDVTEVGKIDHLMIEPSEIRTEIVEMPDDVKSTSSDRTCVSGNSEDQPDESITESNSSEETEAAAGLPEIPEDEEVTSSGESRTSRESIYITPKCIYKAHDVVPLRIDPLSPVSRALDKMSRIEIGKVSKSLSHATVENFSALQKDRLREGQTCIVSHVVTPDEFYIQTDPARVNAVESKLNRASKLSTAPTFRSKQEAERSVDGYCYALWPGRGTYVRVQVLDWRYEDRTMVSVYMIDHGVTFECDYQDLRCRHKSYFSVPYLATRCHLAGVYSPNQHSKTTWPAASNNFLQTICEKKTFVIIYVHDVRDSYGVDLQEEGKPNEKTIGEKLVAGGYAHQEQLSDYSSEDEFENVDNINELIAGYDARDEARICPFTDKSGRCFKGASCRLEHGKLSADGITTDTVLTISRGTLRDAIVPPAGAQVEVLITGYINTCHFYVHILKKARDSDLFNEDFQHLLDTMKANNMVSTYERFKLNPGLSELVLVKEGQDWYRGTCVGYQDDDKVEVFMVDFGYKKTKKLRSLRQMKEEFLHLPAQAVECMLHDCQEKKDIEDDASNEFFNNYMHLEVFKGRVIESGKPLMVQLRGSNNVGISEVLKDWGLGEDLVDLRPPADCPIGLC